MEQIKRTREQRIGGTPLRGCEPVSDDLAEPCQCSGGTACGIEKLAFDLLKERKIAEAYLAASDQIIDNPACWRGHRALATAMLHQHRAQFAAPHFERAIDGFLMSDGGGAFLGILQCEYARALMQSGRLDGARNLFDKVHKALPEYLPAKIGVADCDMRMTATGDRGFNGHKLLDEGVKLEREGDYAGAWRCYVEAKAQLAKQGFIYDRDAVIKRFAEYRSFCNSVTMKHLTRIAEETDTPLEFEPFFVFGYPRSGTTLVEQILSMSGDITPGDELPVIVELVNSMPRFLQSKKPYPHCLSELIISDSRIALKEMRYHYIERVKERLGTVSTDFVTDKMPLNECYLPLIHLLFPYAPKILIRRDPLDVIVSNFSLFLTHGSHQSETPETCADHIERVDDLVRHYFRKIPDLRLLEINYETLVRQPELTIAGICAFAGINAVPDMLHPEKNPRYAMTASYAQVREPISEKRIGRWRRFEPQLREALKDRPEIRYS